MTEVCVVASCHRRPHARGVCYTHSERRRSGDPNWSRAIAPRRRAGQTLIRDEGGRKQCVTCAAWKPESDFTAHPTSLDNLSPHCRNCKADLHLVRSFNITRQEWFDPAGRSMRKLPPAHPKEP